MAVCRSVRSHISVPKKLSVLLLIASLSISLQSCDPDRSEIYPDVTAKFTGTFNNMWLTCNWGYSVFYFKAS